jgi:hypothetical protein
MDTITNLASSNRFSRIIYAALIVAGILHLLHSHKPDDAIVYFALALSFDPFDNTVKWENRSITQKGWLCVHLALVLALVVWFIF